MDDEITILNNRLNEINIGLNETREIIVIIDEIQQKNNDEKPPTMKEILCIMKNTLLFF